MLVRQKLALGVATFAMALAVAGCSSNHPRDINYGNDTGVGFTPPDVAPVDGQAIDAQAVDGQVEETDNSADAGENDVSVGGSPDAAVPSPDASTDGGT